MRGAILLGGHLLNIQIDGFPNQFRVTPESSPGRERVQGTSVVVGQLDRGSHGLFLLKLFIAL